MYELSDQYRTARFVAVNCEYRDDVEEGEEGKGEEEEEGRELCGMGGGEVV